MGTKKSKKNRKHDRPCVLLAQTYWSIAIPPQLSSLRAPSDQSGPISSEKEPGRLIPSGFGDMERARALCCPCREGSCCRYLTCAITVQSTKRRTPCILSEEAHSVSACLQRDATLQQAQLKKRQRWNNWPVAARRAHAQSIGQWVAPRHPHRNSRDFVHLSSPPPFSSVLSRFFSLDAAAISISEPPPPCSSSSTSACGMGMGGCDMRQIEKKAAGINHESESNRGTYSSAASEPKQLGATDKQTGGACDVRCNSRASGSEKRKQRA
ncbi:hypothetical protein J3F84DRAFT_179849 [Trichoderma pleuroticola]